MKTIILAVLLCFSFNCFADEWSKADSYREATYLTFLAVDWAQTCNISRNYAPCVNGSNPYHCSEQNSYLGDHPTLGAVNRYFLVTATLHAGVSYLLPEKYRAPFQYVTIGVEGGYVAYNFSIGISAKF